MALEKLIDFDLINSKKVWLSMGEVITKRWALAG
jgi:hypothetical protein